MKYLVLAGQRLNRLAIGTRLALAFAALLVLTAALGAAALLNLARVEGSVRTLAEGSLPAVGFLGSARAEV
ncbi:MAG: hypothetical protein KGJ24_05615, partial [Burkholderiales bacterium]|nr:hypothetical protein [Burkholderiales bacterium]